jgi:hypothetical protein
MTREERRRRKEYHVVNDYADLVVTGKMITNPEINRDLERAHGANGHVWHSFYVSGRKMFEFFKHAPNGKYLRASEFLAHDIEFGFQHWTHAVQDFMNAHLLHVGAGRVTNTINMDGALDKQYLADFEEAWKQMMTNLKPAHKDVFRDEIDYRLTDAHFRICGTLGREFIL